MSCLHPRVLQGPRLKPSYQDFWILNKGFNILPTSKRGQLDLTPGIFHISAVSGSIEHKRNTD